MQEEATREQMVHISGDVDGLNGKNFIKDSDGWLALKQSIQNILSNNGYSVNVHYVYRAGYWHPDVKELKSDDCTIKFFMKNEENGNIIAIAKKLSELASEKSLAICRDEDFNHKLLCFNRRNGGSIFVSVEDIKDIDDEKVGGGTKDKAPKINEKYLLNKIIHCGFDRLNIYSLTENMNKLTENMNKSTENIKILTERMLIYMIIQVVLAAIAIYVAYLSLGLSRPILP